MSPGPFVILLIEDDHLDAQLFSELCRNVSLDLNVHVCANGREALEYLEQGFAGQPTTRPDLIVLNIQMPIMDGHTFLQEAKQRDHFQLIPMLVLSVSDSGDNIQGSSQHHASGYLVKPDTLEELKALIEVILSYWRGAVRLPLLGELH